MPRDVQVVELAVERASGDGCCVVRHPVEEGRRGEFEVLVCFARHDVPREHEVGYVKEERSLRPRAFKALLRLF